MKQTSICRYANKKNKPVLAKFANMFISKNFNCVNWKYQDTRADIRKSLSDQGKVRAREYHVFEIITQCLFVNNELESFFFWTKTKI